MNTPGHTSKDDPQSAPDRTGRIAIGPDRVPGWLADAVRAGGAQVVPLPEAEALLWAAPSDPGTLREILEVEGEHIAWVQLPWAGIEPYVDTIDDNRLWTCAKGVYAQPVAEMALALMLAAMRGLDRYARSRSWLEAGRIGVNLRGARITVLGGGGITKALLDLLTPFSPAVTVIRNNPGPIAGAERVVGSTDDEIDEALQGTDAVVLALALTPQTTGIIDARRLALMGDTSVLVNVARGRHVVTDDLVAVLEAGSIMGAGLDVTDPEPLPDDHALWSMRNCIVTPHVGNTPEMARPLLAERITDNVAAWISGGRPLGAVDATLGY